MTATINQLADLHEHDKSALKMGQFIHISRLNALGHQVTGSTEGKLDNLVYMDYVSGFPLKW